MPMYVQSVPIVCIYPVSDFYRNDKTRAGRISYRGGDDQFESSVNLIPYLLDTRGVVSYSVVGA